MRESDIEKKAVKHALELGFLAYKFTAPSQPGVPDRCFISPNGAVLFLEFKAPGKRPTALQFRAMEKLRKQNVRATWTNNLDQAKGMLENCDETPIHFNWMYDLCNT